MKFAGIFVALVLAFSGQGRAEEVPIGTIFSMWDAVDYTDVFTAMQYALERQYNDSKHIFQLKVYADKIKTVDAYKLTRIICRQVRLFTSFLIYQKTGFLSV